MHWSSHMIWTIHWSNLVDIHESSSGWATISRISPITIYSDHWLIIIVSCFQFDLNELLAHLSRFGHTFDGEERWGIVIFTGFFCCPHEARYFFLSTTALFSTIFKVSTIHRRLVLYKAPCFPYFNPTPCLFDPLTKPTDFLSFSRTNKSRILNILDFRQIR